MLNFDLFKCHMEVFVTPILKNVKLTQESRKEIL